MGATFLITAAGTGHLLSYLSKKGFNTYGFEPSYDARQLINTKSIKLIDNIDKDNNQYDIITAWHVIEHVPDPKKTLKALKKRLSVNGYLIVAVPNMASFDALYYKQQWAAYDVPRHLYHFNQESFGKLIDKCKLKLVDTLPMTFDSYYVSMLSEKYSNQANNLFKPIKVAYQSNLKARKTGEYSSLIYVMKK